MIGVLAFVLGLSVGSFVNVAADRLPGGRSLVKPRSFCDSCSRTLSTLDMIPVVSYLWLRSSGFRPTPRGPATARFSMRNPREISMRCGVERSMSDRTSRRAAVPAAVSGNSWDRE